MRIMLYIVSLIGFIMLTIQLAVFAASLAAYMAIMVIGIAGLILYYLFKAGVFASIFVTETICLLADATNYSEVRSEQEYIRYNERHPEQLRERQFHINMTTQQAERNMNDLQMMYPLANVDLFQQYLNCICTRQFNQLRDIELEIKRSHRSHLN